MGSIPKPVSNKRQKGEWSTGLFGCFEDYTVCLLTCFCPCITAGRIVEIVDRGQTSCGASGVLYALLGCYIWKRSLCLYSCSYRSKLRSQYLLKESPLPDCCVHLFCHECALCQEYRELQNHGFNMAAGWHGNVETQPPFVQGGMNR